MNHRPLIALLAVSVVASGCQSTRSSRSATRPSTPVQCPATEEKPADATPTGTIHFKKDVDGYGCGLGPADAAAADIRAWDGSPIAWKVVNDCGVEIKVRVKDKEDRSDELSHCDGWTKVPASGGELTCTLKKKKADRCVGFDIHWKSSLADGVLDPVLDIRKIPFP